MFDTITEYFKAGDPNWAWRRRVVLCTALMCWGTFIFAVGWEHDANKASMIMTHAASLLGTIITVYIGGAVVDTMNQRKMANPQPVPPAPSPIVVNAVPGTTTSITGGLASPGASNLGP